MFRSAASRLAFRPENGMKVVVYASLTTYIKDGQYQLTVTHMEPDGIGALYIAFEERRRRLEAEGLFDPSRKRPLPKIPSRIGVITSPTGAAIRDVIRILGRRFPFAEVLLYPAQVQGDGAAQTLIRGLSHFAETRSVDVIILGRGGGSAEDLWEFNDEALARAVAASPIPVISAVGHESDFTICDFVADVRAATPSAAAELAVPESTELVRRFRNVTDRLALLCKQKIDTEGERLRGLAERRIFTDPAGLYLEKHLRLDSAADKLENAMARSTAGLRARFETLTGTLHALSPLAILSRGYSVAQREGTVLKRTEDIPVGSSFRLRLSDGEIAAKRIHPEEGRCDTE
jgi:exodeoxyribonuclease VII large subunit